MARFITRSIISTIVTMLDKREPGLCTMEEEEDQGNPQLNAQMGWEFEPGYGVGVEHEDYGCQQSPIHGGAKIAQESVHEKAGQDEPQCGHVSKRLLHRKEKSREFGHQLAKIGRLPAAQGAEGVAGVDVRIPLWEMPPFNTLPEQVLGGIVPHDRVTQYGVVGRGMRHSRTPRLHLQGYIRGQQYLPIENHSAQE